jgi:DNA transposition AAA+ family ATPase
MAFSIAERRALLTADVAESEDVRARLRDYLARSGLELPDFAGRVGYSRQALYFFMARRYEKIAGSDRALRTAICDFIAANPVAVPEEEEGPVYSTTDLQLLKGYFDRALDRGVAYFVYGAPGTQKSFLLQHLVAELNRAEIGKNGTARRAAYIYCPDAIRPAALLKEVALALGVPALGDARRVFRNIAFELRGRRSILAFDEAQHLEVHCLETVRELLDRPPHCGLIFAGSHNLRQTFQSLEMEQWRSRLRAGKVLPGILEHEARAIITAELGDVPAKKIAKLIASARVRDPRQGKDYVYLSARILIGAVREIKTALLQGDGSAVA